MSKKILIVDDSKVVLSALSMKLQAAGYEVVTAEDGSEGVSKARSARPDAIVLDIGLPSEVGFNGGIAWDGFLMLDWLHRLDEGWSVPVIVITGSHDPHFRERAMATGATAFFVKPIDPERLVAAIHQALGEVPA